MFCEFCGKQIEDDAKFCEYCGARLQQPQGAGHRSPDAETELLRELPSPDAQPTVEGNTPLMRGMPPIKQERQDKNIGNRGIKNAMLIGGVAILFLLCVCAGIFFANGGFDDFGKKEEVRAAAADTGLVSGAGVVMPQQTTTPVQKEITPEATTPEKKTATITVTPVPTATPIERSITSAPTQVPTTAASRTPEIGDYLIGDSNTRNLTEAELSNYTAGEIRLIRNEIYARKGYIFKSQDLKEYFETKPWYNGVISAADFKESMLNSVEYANIQLILKYEKDRNINQS